MLLFLPLFYPFTYLYINVFFYLSAYPFIYFLFISLPIYFSIYLSDRFPVYLLATSTPTNRRTPPLPPLPRRLSAVLPQRPASLPRGGGSPIPLHSPAQRGQGRLLPAPPSLPPSLLPARRRALPAALPGSL